MGYERTQNSSTAAVTRWTTNSKSSFICCCDAIVPLKISLYRLSFVCNTSIAEAVSTVVVVVVEVVVVEVVVVVVVAMT